MRKFITNLLEIGVVLFLLLLVGYIVYSIYVAATT